MLKKILYPCIALILIVFIITGIILKEIDCNRNKCFSESDGEIVHCGDTRWKKIDEDKIKVHLICYNEDQKISMIKKRLI